MRMGQLRGEKGTASPPRRRWKEMVGDKSEFKNAQYPVDTADIYIYIYIYVAFSHRYDLTEMSKEELPMFVAGCCIRGPAGASVLGA